jgi:hypothetical protein
MERKLDLILEIEIRTWQEGPQFFDIWRHGIKQVRLYERGDGWRGRRARPSQDDLHPEAFPT